MEYCYGYYVIIKIDIWTLLSINKTNVYIYKHFGSELCCRQTKGGL